MMKKNCFIVYSDDFGEHPSSCQHLFRYIPKDFCVLWVNTIGMRNPKFTIRDSKKIILKLKKMLAGIFNRIEKPLILERIHVIQPPMLPFNNFSGIKAINKFSVCMTVNKELKKLKMKDPILVATVPNVCDYLGQIDARRIVYYCVDDFAEWPGLNRKLILSMEEDLIREADVFVATSSDLIVKLSNRGKPVHLLTHGVDYDFFRNASVEEHRLLDGIPKPRVGYFGLFDQRSDQDLIIGLATRLPDVSFIITGNIETDISKLRKIRNIYFTGSIPYNDLPAMVKGWDVCALPYKINKLTDAIQPLKVKEYLAAGKPVISTPIKEAFKLKKYVIIAETVESWEKNIRSSVKGETIDNIKKRNKFLQMESWSKKAEFFFKICTEEI